MKKALFIFSSILFVGIIGSCSSESKTEDLKMEQATLSPEELRKGEKVFNEVCTKCHGASRPSTKKERQAMLAPPIVGVMFHVNGGVEASPEDKRQKVIDFIVDYAHNPSAEKSFCEKGAIRRFGVMPTQKDNITVEELKLVAGYLYENYPAKEISHDDLTKDLEE